MLARNSLTRSTPPARTLASSAAEPDQQNSADYKRLGWVCVRRRRCRELVAPINTACGRPQPGIYMNKLLTWTDFRSDGFAD